MTVRNAASMGTYGSTWQHRGYAGGGNVAPLLDSLVGRPAIVAGNARGVFEEVRAARSGLPDAVTFAVNDVGMFLPGVDHWASLHEDKLPNWRAVRWGQVQDIRPLRLHGDDPHGALDYCWQGTTPLFALSGYFAMQIAWLLGCSPIILCGCPGGPAPRFFEADARTDFGYGHGPASSDRGVSRQVEEEMARLPEFKAAVRSMSGWTREFFGGF